MAIPQSPGPRREAQKGKWARWGRPGFQPSPPRLASSLIVFILTAFYAVFPLPASAGAAMSVRTVPAEIPFIWTGIERVIVIGDLHGDYENFEKIIKGKGIELVDSALHWSGGKTHLVQTGDIMDRGDDARKILDVLMRLETEAEATGGKVHVLIGNHEELNIGGLISRYPDYVTWHEFVDFLPGEYRRTQETNLERRIRRAEAGNDRRSPGDIRIEFWNDLKNKPDGQRQYLVGFNDRYGAWLLRHNAVIKIDNTVFVHGGISEKYSLWGIEKINDRFRLELSQMQQSIVYGKPLRLTQPEILYRGDGPLWYRDLATVPEPDMTDEVDRILANLGAQHMVIGHTPRKAVTLKLMKRYGGKVWIVDTGISRAYNNNVSALKIIGREFTVWGGDHEEKDDVGFLGPLALYLLPWKAHHSVANR